ncbi:MAG: hypothetical protein IH838_02915 [Proteobacteria bacterium]|nr:hypothetical protein [Pseudomonadota bacterium]
MPLFKRTLSEFMLRHFYFHRWQQHEFKAFEEFVQESELAYEYIAFSVTGQQVAVRVLDNPRYNA